MSEAASTNNMVKHSAIYAIGNVSRQLVGFLMLPVYTQFLTPADYGAIGLITFVVALLEPLLGARLAQAVPKFFYEEQKRGHLVVSTALIATALISAISVAGLVAFRQPLSSAIFGKGDYGTIVALFSTLLFSQALEYYGLMYIRMRRAPVLFISISLAKLVVQVGLNLWFVVGMQWGVMGVAIGSAVSSMLFGVGVAAYTIRHTGVGFDWGLTKKLIAFCWPLWLAGLATLYIFSSNRYYLRIFSTMDEIGLYELATRFAAILGFLAWEPFMQFWQTERFVYARHEGGIDRFRIVFNSLCAGLVAIALGISLFSGDVIHFMSAPAFYDANRSVALLTLAALFNCLLNFSQFSFLYTDNTRLIGRNNITVAIIVTGFNLALIPSFGHVGASLALMFALVLQFLIVHFSAKKYFDMRLSNRTLIFSFAIATMGYVLASVLNRPENIIMDILVKAVIYALSVALIGKVLLRENAVQDGLLSLVSNIKFLGRIKRA